MLKKKNLVDLVENLECDIALRCVKNHMRIRGSCNLDNDQHRKTCIDLGRRDFDVDLSAFDWSKSKAHSFPQGPSVKSLFAITFNAAYELVERAKSSLSVSDSRKAVEFYEKTLRNYSSAPLLQNYGVSLLELVRKLESSGVIEEIPSLLEKADRALAVALEVQQLGSGADSETAMNWAAVARFQRRMDEMVWN